jgi:hypothetical protein
LTPRHLLRLAAPLPLALACAACGSGSSAPKAPTIQAAHTYRLVGFRPAGKVEPGKPVTVSFTIQQPNGKPLTDYKRGPGPHTGVHLIIVRDDLAEIIHRHPPVAADGKATERVTFPAPGPYRVVVDAYPNVPTSPSGLPTAQSNFQLFGKIDVAGTYKARALPRTGSTVVVDGYRFRMHPHPPLKAVEAEFLTVTVTGPRGRPATFTPWYGALAHAIFFRAGSLDYFHTHVCAAGATGCTSILGAARVVGSSTTPGKLTVGVLLPVPGTWRLFLQTQVDGHILTAPFTLEVR